AQQILREVAEEIRRAASIAQVADRVVARIEAALHPQFAALLVRRSDGSFSSVACAPADAVPPVVDPNSKLVGVMRLLGTPLQISTGDSGWLRQLPPAESEFLRRARIDLVVPVSLAAVQREALLALGPKRSEEPYGAEDRELLLAIANSLALLLERPSIESDQTMQAARRVLAGRYRLDRQLGRGG